MNIPSVWYAVPSARPNGGTLHLWKDRGYKVAVWQDWGVGVLPFADVSLQDTYPGYAMAVNRLCQQILQRCPETQIVVTGGDDIDPPDTSPSTIQEQFVQRFPDLYGVMQPTGDRWMVDEQGKSCSERVAYSPWMGREWILKANQGQGPLWPEYYHFFVDEHLQCAATAQGVFWQRPDLCQYHHWWGRQGESGKRPPHLIPQSKREVWEMGKTLFATHKAQGFVESLPNI